MIAKLPAPPDQPPAKPISKKIRAAIEALVEGTTITAAAERACLRREHLSRELRRPHIAALLHDKIKANLAINAAKAGSTMIALTDSTNELVRFRSSAFLLENVGISAADASSAPAVRRTPGVVIQIIEAPAPRPIDAEPLKIIEA